MTRNHAHHPPAAAVTCQICRRDFAPADVLPGHAIRESVARLIRGEHPDWSPDGSICLEDAHRYYGAYVASVLAEEKGNITELEQEVVRSIREHELVAENVNAEFDRRLSVGEAVADKVADFGGSWTFLGVFALTMAGWIVLNLRFVTASPFDPFPFILLNLGLSCLAAVQAPVIMMSQNRQEAKDRLRSEHDYRVNLKAELEIRHLNAKMDLLLTRQWHQLLEIQQLQTDLMQELLRQRQA